MPDSASDQRILKPADDQHTNKVFQVLQHLDAAETKRLLRYMHSPYFNQSKPLRQLCALLLRQIELGRSTFRRAGIWQKLFPGTPYDDVNFRKYCSDLLGLVEGFLAQEVFEQHPERKALATLEFVVERKLEPLYNSALRDARLRIEQPYRSLETYFLAYALERRCFAMLEYDVKWDVRSNLETIAHNLDIFYWIEKLKLYGAALSQRKTSNEVYQLDFMDEILAYLRAHPPTDAPQLTIYYHAFLTIYEAENEIHYFNLRRSLEEYGAIMPKQEAIELYDSAMHYCTGKVNQGKRGFLQEYFDLFESALERGIFMVKGELTAWRFNNMVAAALGLGKLDWAEAFIGRYKSYLPADTRENTYTFNLTRVYRFQGKYEQVLELLKTIDYEDIGYNLISKMMLLITYYELDKMDELDTFTESFRVFLNRHKHIPQPRRLSYLNLIKYTRRLMRLVPGDKAALERLREEISREKASTVNHEWLLEKLEERG
ncbi:MAG: hypothetical protein LH618_12720 [Saprospiraceae bacterium]|nr:hypothetical protein [Saprospiraceae bacterium]